MSDNPVVTQDQRRAKHALSCVEEVVLKEFATQYCSYVRSLPMLLRLNGLGQTIAFEMAGSAKSGAIGEGHKKLLAHVLSWICDNRKGWKNTPYNLNSDPRKGEDLIKMIVRNSETNMLAAQYELMAYLKWLKTFAEALIEKDDEANSKGEDANA